MSSTEAPPKPDLSVPPELSSQSNQSTLSDLPKLSALFTEIEARFKTTQLGDERWYILALSCLATGPEPELAAHLYQHLIAQPAFSTSASRQRLVRRLREALFKSICVIGVCKPIESILAIAAIERPEDRDLSQSREGWQADADNEQRARDWFRKVYTHNAADTIGLFDAHKDFAWTSMHITYGLYLSDRQALDDVETQLVVLPCIMSQNLKLETRWHIRGTRRIGVSKEDTQVIWDAVQSFAAFFDVKLTKVPTVDDVEPEV
ncbi:hypothetical protein CCM_02543 [Cordyceps militaris CM01]|uniref:Carboxymuconolactone decarboxylase n=2 Tax=Cordyceps militaris TaxID=73501 RepID=G3JAA2_CORMM|nr:uncharacterized protein CCM_02543 [Cordyceps militaris CM01]ATY60843.1 hypothetical protein A9K55_006376 [Cordyceps militaris]EGX94272.1 hypothetical protein CCM_02543 [Cordyceps militaris CM01]